jgi:peptidoglycan/LPS O-acetylase OafA/YrhL
MNFRYDINGLRAIAVIGVVLFHFNANILPGGFAGVDIFFVISGFLMTRIIFNSILSNSFSLVSFYLARFYRIVPALTILSVVLLVFGWFYLPPLDYFSLGKHVLSSLFFISNFIYFNEIGYFDAESHEKWLLHTWSLSVEWQFYIIYPIFIMLLTRIINRDTVKYIILFFTVAGFLFCAIATKLWPEASYYLLSMRFWELLLGGLAYFYQNKILVNKYHAYTGVLIIFCSFIFLSNENYWPGYLAIIPTLAVFFIIISNFQDHVIFCNKVVQSIGLWSYSIYLWHWPIVVFINYYELNNFSYIAILISVLLGWFSHKYFERAIQVKYIFLSALLFSIMMTINNGYMYQMPRDIYESLLLNPKDEKYGDYTWENHKQYTSDFSRGSNRMLIIGDSQAGDFTNILVESGVGSRYEIKSSLISAKCGSFYLDELQRKSLFSRSSDIKEGKVNPVLCNRQWDFIYQKPITKHADVIVIAMNWRDYAIPYVRLSIINLMNSNRTAKIIFVGRKSLGVSIPKSIFYSYKKGINLEDYLYDKSRETFELNKEIKVILDEFKNVIYVDFEDILCRQDKKCIGTYLGDPIFYDGPHSTKEGNIFFSHYIKKLLVENGIL